MKRSDALIALKKATYDPVTIGSEIEFVANKLDMSVNELQECLELPLKTHRDYKNQQDIYKYGAKAMRFLGLDFGGKR